MNQGTPTTAWHRESMLRLYRSGLRDLLRSKLRVQGYRCAESGAAVEVSFGVESLRGPIEVGYPGLPLPDDDGVFTLEGRRLVVVPVADSRDLATSRVRCAGEQLLSFLAERVGGGPAFTEWDEDLLRSLVPLDRLILSFLVSVAQELEAANVYSTIAHLRRLHCPSGTTILPDSQLGLVCPVDQAEKVESIGGILTLCRGAGIEGERIIARSDDPADQLGPTAAAIPFLHHTDPIRAQIGAGQMRQWTAAARAEPALVRTGLEPEDPRVWPGCNLLTAFVSHGKDTYEDSLLVSEAAATRLGFDAESGIGVLLSNRSGQKGVIGVILPEERMPRLGDGTPVELVVSFLALHTRMNTGQLFEAAAGWVARRRGSPFVAPPFAEGDRERIGRELPDAPYRQRLRLATGQEGEGESLVGWVYWGISAQGASNRLVAGAGRYVRQGEMENHVLVRRGAFRTIQERLTGMASEEPVDRGWSVLFVNLRRRLSAAGIRAEMGDSGLHFRLAEPEPDALALEVPLVHSWLPGHTIRAVGRLPEAPGFAELEAANRSLSEGRALPASLRDDRVSHLQVLLDRYFAGLMTHEEIRMGNKPRRSGRGMIAVGTELSFDQIGIPRRMAEALELGQATEWVVVNRAPTMEDTAIVALRPVVVSGDAIRLSPYVCRWLNADFDGDSVAVLVPGSPETQEEAGRLLSVLGHVEADPDTLDTLAPNGEALWGLARLWLSAEGRRELRGALPALGSDDVPLTRRRVTRALRELLEEEGAEPAVHKAVELWDLGFSVVQRSGATLDPFVRSMLGFPEQPREPDPEAWARHREHCLELIATARDYVAPGMGAQLLAVQSGSRGEARNLYVLTAGDGLIEDGTGRKWTVSRGFVPGMDLAGYTAHATVDHELMARSSLWWTSGEHPGFPSYRPHQPEGPHVLARARRSKYPGIVFARAAQAGETDPLSDAEARLFVGLLPRERARSVGLP